MPSVGEVVLYFIIITTWTDIGNSIKFAQKHRRVFVKHRQNAIILGRSAGHLQRKPKPQPHPKSNLDIPQNSSSNNNSRKPQDSYKNTKTLNFPNLSDILPSLVERLPENYGTCEDAGPIVIDHDHGKTETGPVGQKSTRKKRQSNEDSEAKIKTAKEEDSGEICQPDICHTDCKCVHFARTGLCKRLTPKDNLEHCVCSSYQKAGGYRYGMVSSDCMRIRKGMFPNLSGYVIAQGCNAICRTDCRCNHGAEDGICASYKILAYCRCIY